MVDILLCNALTTWIS